MSNQILISSGAKLRDLDDVIIGTDGVLTSLGFNVANGVPKLDENGKILVSQLPNSVMEFKGVWNAATNTPTLADGTGNAGDVYLCNVAGTVNFGAGPITFAVGDYAVYTGSVWARSSGATGTVTSVGLSRDGDALSVTGSPITTSGTINLGFTGTNLQYINGAGNLTTFPDLTVYVPTSRTLTINDVTYDLSANRSWTIDSMIYPDAGIAVSTGTAWGTSIIDNSGNWNTAYNNSIISAAVTGTTTKTLTLDQQDGGTITASWTDYDTAPVTSVFGRTGAVVAVSGDYTTAQVTESGNLYFTDARARAAISLTTLGTSGEATYNNTTGVLNIPNYTTDLTGYVPYTGATTNVNLGTHSLSAYDLIINHTSGSGVAASITKGGNGEALTVVKSSGSGNAASITGGVTLLDELHLTTDLADAYIASAATWNSKQAGSTNLTSLAALTFASTSFVKMTAAGTFALDTNTYALASALGDYLPLAGGTLTGPLNSNSQISTSYKTTSAAILIDSGGAYNTNPVSFFNNSYPNDNTKYFAQFSANWAGSNTWGIGVRGANDNTIYISSASSGVLDPTNTAIVLRIGNHTAVTSGNISSYAITGTGSTNKIAKFNGASTLVDSYISDAAGNPTIINKDASTITSALFSIAPATSTNASILNLDNAGAGSFYAGRQNSAGNSQLIGSLGTYDSVLGHTGTQTLHLVTNGLSRLAINGSGNAAFTGTITASSGVYAGDSKFFNSVQLTDSLGGTCQGFLWTDAANTLKLGTGTVAGGNVKMTITSGGNVGIGTDSPSYALSVVKNTSDWIGQFKNYGSSAYGLQIDLSGSTGAATNSAFQVYTQTGTGLRLVNNGTLMLGTTTGVSGGGALQVNGNVNINGVFQINGVTIGGGGGSGVTGSGTNGYMTKWTGSSTLGNSIIQDNGSSITVIAGVEAIARFWAAGDGTIIIGGNAAQGTSSGEQYITYQNGTTNTNAWLVGMDDGEDFRFAYGAAGEITDANTLARISQSGNWSLGSIADNGYRLQVYGGGISLQYGYIFNLKGSGSDILIANTGSTMSITGNVSVGGSVTASGGFFDTSDARLKTLVEDNYLLNSIANVKAKLYIKNNRKELGYYAQDIQSILPYAVNEGSDGFLSLSYAQVHTAKIAVIEDKVTILENEVAELKSKLQKYEA